nr:hypothetical protein [Halodesulfurarchaeum formicicum]
MTRVGEQHGGTIADYMARRHVDKLIQPSDRGEYELSDAIDLLI